MRLIAVRLCPKIPRRLLVRSFVSALNPTDFHRVPTCIYDNTIGFFRSLDPDDVAADQEGARLAREPTTIQSGERISSSAKSQKILVCTKEVVFRVPNFRW